MSWVFLLVARAISGGGRTKTNNRAKARAADAQFVEGGSGRIPNALNAIPEVKGLVLGAFGEFSSSVNAPIDGFAHEGAPENPDRFGQSNYKAAYGGHTERSTGG